MKTKTVVILLLSIWWTTVHVRAQQGFSIPKGIRQVEIPFEYVNNFIILNIAFNGPLPLKFIYDTGAEHTILTKREISDFLHVQYNREFRVRGSDLKTEMIAYLARNIKLQVLNREVIAPREDILVLQEDYFRFEEYAGIEVHGILAGRVFSNYLVKINYQRRVITLYERGINRLKAEGFEAIPLEVYRNKLYLTTSAQLRADSSAPIKLLLDTGAGLPVMLFTNTHPLIQPAPNAIPSNIGMGLGGYLEGFVGRMPQLDLPPFSQQNVLIYYQTVDTTQDLTYLNGRNGLIGNALLNRFHVAIDYQEEKLWLKPSKHYRETFVYDRSGLNLIAAGPHLNYFSVLNVLPGSPADEAGILAGDRLLRIGWMPAGIRSLSDLQAMLQKKVGKKVKIVIKRNGKVMKKWIVLRDLI
ncbi:MAG: PDZ domain-containing protein [Saprospiraceae bacterium]|nr:PDZ domain-containing protein [Saprospiraceae bacterium]